MTDQATPQAQPRGAGSGEKAAASRGSTSLIDWPPEPVAHKDAVDALEKEAQAQADYNEKINVIQTEQAKKVQEVVGHPQGEAEDPDKAREEAMQAYVNENDPKKKEAALKGEMKARAEREKAAAK